MDSENKTCGVITSLVGKIDFSGHNFEQYDTDLDDERIFRENICNQCGQIVGQTYMLQRTSYVKGNYQRNRSRD